MAAAAVFGGREGAQQAYHNGRCSDRGSCRCIVEAQAAVAVMRLTGQERGTMFGGAQEKDCWCQTVALPIPRERRGGFDVGVNDVHMRNMNGFKLLDLVGHEMDLPVIMMSAERVRTL